MNISAGVCLRSLFIRHPLNCFVSAVQQVRGPPILIVFLPRDASAERGNATVSRLSVRLSVCDV